MDQSDFAFDYYRITGRQWNWARWFDLYRDPALRFLYLYRTRKKHGKWRLFLRFSLHGVREKFGLDIEQTARIGKGLYINHPYNIAINGAAAIGDNVNITKGVTIGQEIRGTRKGAPTIGNRVWIGANAVIVGKITVGDDVLIAANTFVNCDVPPHSVVVGNPCKIIHKENATEEYINRVV